MCQECAQALHATDCLDNPDHPDNAYQAPTIDLGLYWEMVVEGHSHDEAFKAARESFQAANGDGYRFDIRDPADHIPGYWDDEAEEEGQERVAALEGAGA